MTEVLEDLFPRRRSSVTSSASNLSGSPSPLIFLDEPTTGLDPRTRGQMRPATR
jgi:ABC-type multidrug transport system ATPase subunit